MPQNISANNAAAQNQGAQEIKGPPVDLRAVPDVNRPGDTYEMHNAGGLTPVVSETQGRRESQEDAYVITETPNRNARDVPGFLENSYSRIDNSARASQVRDGATANTVYISADADHTITVANAGDARTVMLVRDVDTGKVTATRLSYDHKAGDPAEIARIEAAGGRVAPDDYGKMRTQSANGRGALAVSRAIGDHNYPGVTSTPDITQVKVGNLVNNPRQEVYIVNSCDGVYETMSEKDLAQIAQDHLGKGPASPDRANSLAKVFTNSALHTGSQDNLTATVTKLSPNQTQDVIISTFDGHGGSTTSKLAASTMRDIASESPERARGPVAQELPRIDETTTAPYVARKTPLQDNVIVDMGRGPEAATRTAPGDLSHERLLEIQAQLKAKTGVEAKFGYSTDGGKEYLAVPRDFTPQLDTVTNGPGRSVTPRGPAVQDNEPRTIRYTPADTSQSRTPRIAVRQEKLINFGDNQLRPAAHTEPGKVPVDVLQRMQRDLRTNTGVYGQILDASDGSGKFLAVPAENAPQLKTVADRTSLQIAYDQRLAAPDTEESRTIRWTPEMAAADAQRQTARQAEREAAAPAKPPTPLEKAIIENNFVGQWKGSDDTGHHVPTLTGSKEELKSVQTELESHGIKSTYSGNFMSPGAPPTLKVNDDSIADYYKLVQKIDAEHKQATQQVNAQGRQMNGPGYSSGERMSATPSADMSSGALSAGAPETPQPVGKGSYSFTPSQDAAAAPASAPEKKPLGFSYPGQQETATPRQNPGAYAGFDYQDRNAGGATPAVPDMARPAGIGFQHGTSATPPVITGTSKAPSGPVGFSYNGQQPASSPTTPTASTPSQPVGFQYDGQKPASPTVASTAPSGPIGFKYDTQAAPAAPAVASPSVAQPATPAAPVITGETTSQPVIAVSTPAAQTPAVPTVSTPAAGTPVPKVDMTPSTAATVAATVATTKTTEQHTDTAPHTAPQPHSTAPVTPEPVAQPKSVAPVTSEPVAHSPEVPAAHSEPVNLGAHRAGAGAGLALGSVGFVNALRNHDGWGALTSGGNVVTSARELQLALKSAGELTPEIASKLAAAGKANIVLTVIDGTVQISREDGAEHKLQRGTLVAGTAATGALAGSLGGGLLSTVALPAVVGYTGEKTLEVVRAREQVNNDIAAIQPENKTHSHLLVEEIQFRKQLDAAGVTKDAQGHYDMTSESNSDKMSRILKQHEVDLQKTINANETGKYTPVITTSQAEMLSRKTLAQDELKRTQVAEVELADSYLKAHKEAAAAIQSSAHLFSDGKIVSTIQVPTSGAALPQTQVQR